MADSPNDGFSGAVDAALDDLLGPVPTDLVEEQPEPDDPADENEAKAHLYRSPSKLYGLG
jgi:hypothetical protein